MNVLEYFKVRLEATMSPVDVMAAVKSGSKSVCVIDVRNGPAQMLKERIPGALQIPENVITKRIADLPKDKTLVLYCWDTWCGLAAKAAIPLLERGYHVRELFGGIKAWKSMRLPTEPVDDGALKDQPNPLEGFGPARGERL